MLYYLFKLKFLAPVHFGADIPGIGLEKSSVGCHADTLFSAFCHEALALYGEEGLQKLVDEAGQGRLLLSDVFPYIGDELYLPRPVLHFERAPVARPSAVAGQADQHAIKKRLKKLAYIPVNEFASYLQFLRDGGDEIPFELPCFGMGGMVSKVAIRGSEEPQPYNVGIFTFNHDAGLYFILGIDSADRLDYYKSLLESLAYSGLGGKRTSGCGRFEPAEDEIELDTECSITESDYRLAAMLHADTPLYMSLSVISPREDDWEYINAPQTCYTLVQRRGFIYSASYSDRFQKRRPLVMLNAGSCFPGKLRGSIVDVSSGGGHSVYRYGMGLMIGVMA